MARKTSIEIFRELIRELGGASLKPVYCIGSEESFFQDRIIEAVSALVPDEQKDFNFDILFGRDTNMDTIVGIARSFPMMADRRVLIVRDYLSVGEGDSGNGTPEELMPYLDHPNPSTLLLLVDEKAAPGNTKFGKSLQKNPNVGFYKFEPVPDYKLTHWIEEWARISHGLTFDPAAAELLARHVGNNLQQLTTEIDKIGSYSDEQRNVGPDVVRELVGITRGVDVFELKDALLSRDPARALGVTHQLLQNTDNEVGEVMKTIGFLYGYYANLWQITRARDRGLSPEQIQEKVGVRSNFYFNNLMKDARNFRIHQFPFIFETLLDADKAVKGFGILTAGDVLLMTVNKLMGTFSR